MISISNYSDQLLYDEAYGFWRGRSNSSVSYPEDGNETFFQIEDSSFWFNHRNNCILTVLKQYDIQDDFIFDIGGGNGYVALALEKNNFQSVLLEPGFQGCINARKRGLKNIVCSTLQDAGLKENMVKAIGCFDVVEHIEDDMSFMNSIYETLKPGGIFISTVPALDILWSQEDVAAGHFRRYSVGNYKAKLERAGFKDIYCTYFFQLLPIPIFLFRVLPYKVGIKHEETKDETLRKHQPKEGLDTQLIKSTFSREINAIAKRKVIAFGSSVLAVGVK